MTEPEIQEFNDADAAPNETLDLLMDTELPMLVRFGTTHMLLADLLRLNPGSVIEFDSVAENAVEILVNDRVVARGEAVVVQGNYGVRISQILPAQPPVLNAGVLRL